MLDLLKHLVHYHPGLKIGYRHFTKSNAVSYLGTYLDGMGYILTYPFLFFLSAVSVRILRRMSRTL